MSIALDVDAVTVELTSIRNACRQFSTVVEFWIYTQSQSDANALAQKASTSDYE